MDGHPYWPQRTVSKPRKLAVVPGSQTHWQRSIFVAFLPLAFASCAIGTVGTFTGRITTTDTAVIVDTQILGLWIRPEMQDRGISLGYRSTSHIHPNTAGLPPTSKRWVFLSPQLKTEPICTGTTLLGAAADGSPDRGLSLGFKSSLITVGPALGESAIVELRFNRAHPEHTYVRIRHQTEQEH